MKIIYIFFVLCLPFSSSFSRDFENKEREHFLGSIFLVESVVVYSLLEDSLRFSYTYDENQNLLTMLKQEIQFGNWRNSKLSTNIYDSQENILTKKVQIWQNAKWNNSTQETYTYPLNGKKGNYLTLLIEQWTNEQWVSSNRKTQTVDTDGNIISMTNEQWSGGQWQNVQRNSYTVDSKGNRLTNLNEQWQNGQWVNSRNTTCTYDAKGNNISIIVELWQNGQWINYQQTLMSYDTGGNQTEWKLQNWYGSKWGDNIRYSYTYYAKGKVLNSTIEKWQNGQWVLFASETYTYDQDGNNLIYLYEQPLTTGVKQRFTYTYDASGNMLTELYEEKINDVWTATDSDFGLTFTDKRGVTYGDYGIYDGFAGFKAVITYSSIVNVPEVTNNAFSLTCQPNPASEFISVSFSKSDFSNTSVNILNSLGIIMKSYDEKELSGQNSIILSTKEFLPGVYFFQIKSENYLGTKKFVVIK